MDAGACFKVLTQIHLKRLIKTAKHCTEDSQSRGRYANQAHPKYKYRQLLIHKILLRQRESNGRVGKVEKKIGIIQPFKFNN